MRIASIVSLFMIYVGAFLVAYRLFKFPSRGLRRYFDVQQLAVIEAGLIGLDQVLVVAHQIEKPTNDLREAVKKNFLRKVKYIFLVSHSRAEREMRGDYKVFEEIAKEIINNYKVDVNVDDLVSIYKLPYDWHDLPYVFYQVRILGKGPYVACLRGNQQREGIAEGYFRVSPRLASTIAKTVMQGAPALLKSGVDIQDQAFEDLPANVIKLTRKAS